MDNKYFLGFSVFEGIGPMRMGKLLKYFKTAENAWQGKEKELKEIIGKKTAESFVEFRNKFSIDRYTQELHRKNIQYVTFVDKNYPELLKKSPKRPFLLYIKGDTKLLNYHKTIAIVGTRKITAYGEQVTEMLTARMVNAGFVVVSGLAFGVDCVAHISTMDNGGKTIAVLGCGVDCCTPISNQQIYNKILETGGTIVSTLPPGIGANKGSFPARNAIIAGLSLGVLVTEGAEDSGALITANYAFTLQRPVFAVPGPITSGLSKGPNSLFAKGAIVASEAKNVLDRLGIISARKTQTTQKFRLSENSDEQSILNLLESGPLHFDEIVRRIRKSAKEVGSLLSMMEIKGIVRTTEGMYSLSF